MDDMIRLVPPIEPLGNDERLEWVMAYAQPHEPATQKRMIIQAGMGPEPVLDPQQVNLALCSLGLEGK
ncbi:MAG: hypothetical protein JKY34_07400 [Kordiimonadaceae bacterium]|nr:hypothetical protein [Kordiimonadaceae bacterium]